MNGYNNNFNTNSSFFQIFHEIIVHKVVMYKVSSLLNYGALIKVKVDRTPAELTSANDCFHIDLLYITSPTKRHTQMASVNDSYQVESLLGNITFLFICVIVIKTSFQKVQCL